jgi:HSP20 family protein
MAASSLALKSLFSFNLFSRSLLPVRSVAQPVSSRIFSSNALRECGFSGRRRRCHREVLDPFSTSGLSQIPNRMGQLVDSPVTSCRRRNWDAKETADGLHLRVFMPGLGKEDVKVSVERNTLIIKGEGKKESEGDGTERRYASRIDLPEKLYKTDAIEAEIRNGVLKVFLPKVKGEERTDVFHVNVV